LFTAIFEHQTQDFDGSEQVIEPQIEMAFEFFKNQFELDNKKWEKRVEAQRANGKKGGRPKNSVEDDAPDEKPNEPKETRGLFKNPTKPKKGEKGKEIEINKVSVRALRINYMGELGWELHHPMKQMESLYDAIYEVGKKDNIANFGTYAVNSLRMEKAYRGWGAELTGEISLVEAGMDRFFNLNKKSNFIGSEILREKLQSGVDIKIVYLEIDVDDADARGNEPVYHNNKIVGVVTSGGYGFRINKSLAFAYVQAELAKDETELFVEIQGQKRNAKILNSPAYDPQNKKLKS